MRLLILSLTCVTYSLFSQNVLLKKNGDQIRFKRYKIEDNTLVIVTPDRDEARFHHEEIIGYYDEDQQVLMYKVHPLDFKGKGFVTWQKISGSSVFEFEERLMDGEIRLYRREYGSPGYMTPTGVTPAGMMPVTSTVYLFAERDGEMKNIFIGGLFSNDEQKSVLLALIADDAELSARLSSNDFKFNEKNIIQLVTDYNTNHFKNLTKDPLLPVKSVGFYTRVRKKIKESIVIKVNDSLEYRLGPKFPVQVPLPVGVPSKVCVTSLAGNGCMFITAIPFTLYFEIKNRVFDDRLSFARQSLNEFKNFMQYTMTQN